MPIEFFRNHDELRVRQSFESPTVYMDHWAIMTFSEDLVLQDRFISAMALKGGTLLLSNISMGEFAEAENVRHSLDAEKFLERVLPNIFLTDFAFDKLLAREQVEVNNERRFWPPADLPQLKLLAELAPGGPPCLTVNTFVQMAHQHRIELANVTAEVVNKIRDGFEQVRKHPDYVLKAKNTLPSEKRTRTMIIMGKLMRGFNLDSNASISENDVIDFLHAAMPINCCDYVLLDGPWVGRVNTLKQRIASTGMNMPIAKCFSKTKNGGVEAFLDSLEAFIAPESPALR